MCFGGVGGRVYNRQYGGMITQESGRLERL